jgi:hypothetical protein
MVDEKIWKFRTSMVATDQILNEKHFNDAHDDHERAEDNVGDCFW